MTRQGRSVPFAHSVAGILVVKAAVLVLGIAAGAIVARALGAEGKGILTLALLVPLTLDTLLNAGIGTAHVYHAGGRRFGIRALSENALLFALVLGGAGLAMVALLLQAGLGAVLLPGLSTGTILLAAAALPLLLISRFSEGILQGIGRLMTAHVVRAVEAAAVLGLLLVLVVIMSGGAVAAVAAYVGGAVASSVLLLALLRMHGGRIAPRWDPVVGRATLRYGMRGHAGNVLQYMNYRLDMFMVVYFLGPAALGIYSVAVRLAELLWHLPDAVGFAIFPKAAGSTAAAMNRFTPRAFLATLGITTVAGLVLAAAGLPLIRLIYSGAFTDAFLPLLALLPGAILLGAAKVLTNDIAGRGFPHYNSINAGIALVVTVALDFILIPRIGVVGAAVASSIAYALVFVLAILFYRKVARGTPRPHDPAAPENVPAAPHAALPNDLEG